MFKPKNAKRATYPYESTNDCAFVCEVEKSDNALVELGLCPTFGTVAYLVKFVVG